MSEKLLNVGIVGLAHLHPRSYMPLFDAVAETNVVAVSEGDDDLRKPFEIDFGVKGYAVLDDMLAENIDIAAIFLPHVDCPDAAESCAAKGIHLMVEKPMASTAEGAQRIVEAARRHNVKLTTGYCWRMHPAAREFRRIVQSGMLGDIVSAEGRCAAGKLQRYIDGKSPWILEKELSGGGPMYNLGVHWIDLFRWILGDEVVEVSGRNLKVNTEYNVEDNSFAHARFSRDTILALNISYTVPDAFPFGRDLYLSVRGTRGCMDWAPAYEGEQDELVICTDEPDDEGAQNRRQVFELEPSPGYSGIMGLEYVRDFVASILDDGIPEVTGEDGVAALQIVEAIYKSDREKCWVDCGR
ncbi:MAG: Gfo/Idh/MocA family oxidoreductase [Lentisphaerae bacterium]|nr:Gfo/Idh/MocA family oxidoreductase [Lentisphaerota bacterium]